MSYLMAYPMTPLMAIPMTYLMSTPMGLLMVVIMDFKPFVLVVVSPGAKRCALAEAKPKLSETSRRLILRHTNNIYGQIKKN